MLRYTTEDLLLYVYGETTEEQTKAMIEAIEADWELKEQLYILQNSIDILDKMIESPRVESVNAILNYANTSAALEHTN
jgi:anti-sigma factor RsiW